MNMMANEPDYKRLIATTGTASACPICEHKNGWYVVVNFWIFRKRIFVCSDCGHHWCVPLF
jgi:transposase